MKVIDLFCGIGGFSLGFQRAGFEVSLGIDIDPVCCRNFSSNLKVESLCRDVRNLDPREFDVDVVIGSPPCKSFSFASQRRHRPDPENDLIFEYARFVEQIQPEAFAFENVVGLRVGWRKKLVYDLKKRLVSKGYHVIDVILNAYEFGVPQTRKRLFLIGLRNASFFTPVRREGGNVRDAFRGVEGKPNHIWQKSRKAREVMRYIPQGKSLSRVWKKLPQHLQRRYASFANMHNNIYYRLAWDKPSITICNPAKAMILHPEEDRVISVREAMRLQSLPDDFILVGPLRKQYQMTADAVPPPLSEAIANFIKREA